MDGRARPRLPDFAAVGSPVRIENYFFIGSSVTILPGVSIGEGAAIGAGAAVTKDIQDWAAAIGIPEKAVRERPRVCYMLSKETRALFQ